MIDMKKEINLVGYIDMQYSLVITFFVLNDYNNKTLGRARDPRANGAWLSKLTE